MPVDLESSGITVLGVSHVARAVVAPLDAQVAIVDSTWQDYPQWESGEEWVACQAPSLIHPDDPPYPGLAVATRGDISRTGPQLVEVEVWEVERPAGLHRVHATILAVGNHGVEVGNQQGGGSVHLDLDRGEYPIEVWVDAESPDTVSRVVFVIEGALPSG